MAVFDDILDVFIEQAVSLDGGIDVMHPIGFASEIWNAEKFLHLVVSVFGERRGMVLLVDYVVNTRAIFRRAFELLDRVVGTVVLFDGLGGSAADDMRNSGRDAVVYSNRTRSAIMEPVAMYTTGTGTVV